MRNEINILEFIQTHRRGELLKCMQEAQDELMQAIAETGLPGSISIKLDWKRNKADQLECHPSISIKQPKRPIGVGFYFLTEEARLTRRDPNQIDIEDEIQKRRVMNAETDDAVNKAASE